MAFRLYLLRRSQSDDLWLWLWLSDSQILINQIEMVQWLTVRWIRWSVQDSRPRLKTQDQDPNQDSTRLDSTKSPGEWPRFQGPRSDGPTMWWSDGMLTTDDPMACGLMRLLIRSDRIGWSDDPMTDDRWSDCPMIRWIWWFCDVPGPSPSPSHQFHRSGGPMFKIRIRWSDDRMIDIDGMMSDESDESAAIRLTRC